MAKRITAGTANRVAVVQHPPVMLHRKETLERAVTLMEEAAVEGARLVSFPEAWIPGYPEWLWRLRPGDDWELSAEIHGRLLENSVDLGPWQQAPIQNAAKRLKVTVALGINQRDGEFSRATLYNTVLVPDLLTPRRAPRSRLLAPRRRRPGRADGRGDRHGRVQARCGRTLAPRESPSGRMHFAMDEGQGRPSRWNTLQAV